MFVLSWGEMEVLARVLAPPVHHLGCFGRAVVIQDQTHLQVRRHLRLDLLAEGRELLVPVARMAASDHLAAGDRQGRKERDRSVPIVIMRAPLGLPWAQRQNGLAAVQCLTWLFSSTPSTIARVASGGLR